MARDPIIGDFHSSLTPDAVVVSRPQEIGGTWNLLDLTPHWGRNADGDRSLLTKERLVVRALVIAKPNKWIEYADCLRALVLEDDPEYWLTSAMVKLQVTNLGDLFAAVDRDPDLLENPPAPAQVEKAGKNAGGPIVYAQG